MISNDTLADVDIDQVLDFDDRSLNDTAASAWFDRHGGHSGGIPSSGRKHAKRIGGGDSVEGDFEESSVSDLQHRDGNIPISATKTRSSARPKRRTFWSNPTTPFSTAGHKGMSRKSKVLPALDEPTAEEEASPILRTKRSTRKSYAASSRPSEDVVPSSTAKSAHKGGKSVANRKGTPAVKLTRPTGDFGTDDAGEMLVAAQPDDDNETEVYHTPMVYNDKENVDPVSGASSTSEQSRRNHGRRSDRSALSPTDVTFSARPDIYSLRSGRTVEKSVQRPGPHRLRTTPQKSYAGMQSSSARKSTRKSRHVPREEMVPEEIVNSSDEEEAPQAEDDRLGAPTSPVAAPLDGSAAPLLISDGSSQSSAQSRRSARRNLAMETRDEQEEVIVPEAPADYTGPEGDDAAPEVEEDTAQNDSPEIFDGPIVGEDEQPVVEAPPESPPVASRRSARTSVRQPQEVSLLASPIQPSHEEAQDQEEMPQDEAGGGSPDVTTVPPEPVPASEPEQEKVVPPGAPRSTHPVPVNAPEETVPENAPVETVPENAAVETVPAEAPVDVSEEEAPAVSNNRRVSRPRAKVVKTVKRAPIRASAKGGRLAPTLATKAKTKPKTPKPKAREAEGQQKTQKRPRSTTPLPFRLRTSERGEVYQRQFSTKVSDEEREKRQLAKFHAQPLVLKAPFQVRKTQKPVTEPHEPKFRSNARIEKRHEMEEDQRQREAETVRLHEEEKAQREEQERVQRRQHSRVIRERISKAHGRYHPYARGRKED